MHDVIVQNQNGNMDDDEVHTSRNQPSRSAHVQHLHVEIPADGHDGNVVPFFMEDDLVQNPWEKESHQTKMSVRVPKYKLRDSTIHEESHQIMCKSDTQKPSDVENKPCEEISTSNMTTSSSFAYHVLQVHDKSDAVKYDLHPILDEEDQETASDIDAMNIVPVTKLSFEKTKDDYVTTTITRFHQKGL